MWVRMGVGGVAGGDGAILCCGQILLLPLVLHYLPLKAILVIGVGFGTIDYFLLGLAWAPWVPYATSGLAALGHLSFPA
eukprot:jgi/Mesen1/9811/ME000007S09869